GWNDAVSRRSFLKLMGASLAFAGLTACYPIQRKKIVAYVKAPEEIVAGKPLFFATTMPFAGYAMGLLAESHMGRPTKLEGNPKHPASFGATDIYAQAEPLVMYDPDRAIDVTNATKKSTWKDFTTALAGAPRNGGLRILTGTLTSPSLIAQIQAVLKANPGAKWHQYEPFNLSSVRAGSRMAFGSDVQPIYAFEKADIVFGLDADFMDTAPGGVRYSKDFATARRVRHDKQQMNRFYAAESSPNTTGSMADHRLRMKPSEIESLARLVANRLGVTAAAGNALGNDLAKWVDAAITDLQAHRGRSLVVAGVAAAPVVHALAYAMNAALGNIGQTVSFIASPEAVPVDHLASIQELATDLKAGAVDSLLIIGTNPAFTAPAELGFAELISKAKFSAYLGLYHDETANLTQWHVPESHFLEAWGDARAFDGTTSIIQPLIEPLYRSKSAGEMIAAVAGQADKTSYDLIQAYWKGQRAAGFDSFWETTLHDGLIVGSASPTVGVSVKSGFAGEPQAKSDGLELILRLDPTIFDGRYANNGWLQELPKPLTSLTWDNAALIAPATAEEYKVRNGDVIELTFEGRSMKVPVWIMAGHCAGGVTVYLGYGRTRTGRVGTGTGFNAYPLRSVKSPWGGTGLAIKKTEATYPLVSTQDHFTLEGSREDVFQAKTLASLAAAHGGHAHAEHTAGQPLHNKAVNPHTQEREYNGYLEPVAPVYQSGLGPAQQHLGDGSHAREEQEELSDLSLYPQWKYEGNAWGMVIDLSVCNGCSACVVACNSENNITIVGKEEVAVGREMHWIKVDRYYSGDENDPSSLNHQPRMCVHCEKAPCETVCPVEATVHDAEGLNIMAYNRCVGTRYCANNCPYKVRRFNFYDHTAQWFGQEGWSTKVVANASQLGLNPDVSVRSRGVMEKCSYCVQRINAARIEAKKEMRPIKDGEVVTACQAACPTEAIIFGNLNDASSRVSRLKKEKTNFFMLPELNTAARTTYLARIVNPNPALNVESPNAHG
ncbi:MAG: 4Fe-4S dicluster domain-containing protein, partial [Candidatus Sericytochromatia bacterium]|nr:4Fe-4S dicluster domain-containing protein [Candidatus Sericytochromatia bacterium]